MPKKKEVLRAPLEQKNRSPGRIPPCAACRLSLSSETWLTCRRRGQMSSILHYKSDVSSYKRGPLCRAEEKEVLRAPLEQKNRPPGRLPPWAACRLLGSSEPCLTCVRRGQMDSTRHYKSAVSSYKKTTKNPTFPVSGGYKWTQFCTTNQPSHPTKKPTDQATVSLQITYKCAQICRFSGFFLQISGFL